jgi:hypothetical protein
LAHWAEFDQNEVKDTVTVERILPCLRALHVAMPSLTRGDGGGDSPSDVFVTVDNTELGRALPPPPVPRRQETDDDNNNGGGGGGDDDDDDDAA